MLTTGKFMKECVKSDGTKECADKIDKYFKERNGIKFPKTNFKLKNHYFFMDNNNNILSSKTLYKWMELIEV